MRVAFVTGGEKTISSVTHRCIMVGEELKKRYDYDIEMFYKRDFGNVPNYLRDIKNWLKISKSDIDCVVIHKTSNILDYLFMSKLKYKGTPIIYDFDDALFHTRFLGRWASYSHLISIIKNANAVTAGSHYLFDYSKKLNENTFLLPTPVDTNLFHPKKKSSKKKDYVIIGWLGAGTELQLPYLKILKKPLKILSQKHDIKFKIVSALSEKVRAEFRNLGFKVDFGLNHWVPLDRVPDLISDFDIGVMPLTDDPFSRGKCAMKALEYMAMEIPAVVSNVGENQYIIKNGVNGFLASNVDEWVKQLNFLIEDRSSRREIGEKARKTVEDKYSLNVCGKKMRNLIQELSDRKC